ncbi:MAG: RluA family pseudouridine synthase [Clostridia bacterium]|nr:RluA family pseudouridine synthase [Clostridia bacterium]
MILEYTAVEADDGEKVLSILKKRLRCSGTLVKRLKSNNAIWRNGSPTLGNIRINAGDVIAIEIIEHRDNDAIKPSDIPLDILYEDPYIVVLNKDAGIAVHPAGKYQDDTLANGLRFHFMQKGIDMTARPVGRLDRNTSGVVIFAKNSHVMTLMISALKEDSARKIYVGLTHGNPVEDEGLIDLPIKRAEDSIIARISAADGKPSMTKFRVLERFGSASLVEFELLTGRTHQIRLHSKELGHPLVGDGIYGDDSATMHIIDRHALHCASVSFIHPFTGGDVEINAPYPEDFKSAVEFFKNKRDTLPGQSINTP